MWSFTHGATTFFFSTGGGFVFPQKNLKGVGSIRKNKIMAVTKTAGVVLGVALSAASFFILRRCTKNLFVLEGRVEELEYDRLREAYRQQGYSVD